MNNMENSKEWMKENGYAAKISFSDGGAHTVKLISDNKDSIPDGSGGKVEGMMYKVEEAGEEKTIFTGSVGLIGKLAEVDAGTVVTIQMKKANNKSFYVVTKADGTAVGQTDQISDDEEVPADPSWDKEQG